MVVAMAFGVVACNKDNNESAEDTTYKVTFDVQGHGTAPKTQVVDAGGHAVEPQSPSQDGWTFGGWYKETGCENEYVFATEVVNADITVYAKWTESSQTPPEDDDDKDPPEEKPLGSLPTDKTPTIYLAGDSTVQAYSDAQYIAGWGQYLNLFLDENVKVVNAARGGRSSRSFINEDRLFKDTDGTPYKFSENGGKSIEETIQAGDFLFVQFGHNDDDTKGESGYSYMPDRMVPLGTPDGNGIYPTTAPEGKKPTTYLPDTYIAKASDSEENKMLKEIANYGAEYYAYGDGTYKWYLKQYIDLARTKGAIPVLVTPVARVAFNSDGTLKDGPGRHGDNFAYVEAVRQLAEEENCLLIDNFAYTKETLEKATSQFSDFLMAIVPNDINNGPWPTGYDNAYHNSDAKYEKMEGTHYNKYGAYLTAAYVAESIIESNAAGTVKGSDSAKEYYTFGSKVLTTPRGYIQPSNRMSISKVAVLEDMFDKVNPTDPNRQYVQPSVAIKAIEDLAAKGDKSTITEANYEEWKGYCEEARAVYESLNFDLRGGVTNLSVLEEYEAAVKAARPKPVSTVVLNASNFVKGDTPVVVGEHTFSFYYVETTDTTAQKNNIISYAKKGAAFTYNDVQYAATTQAMRSQGNGNLTGATPTKYIEFTLTGAATVTIVASGGGSTTDVVLRYIQMVDENKKEACDRYAYGPDQAVVSREIEKGGTYRIASTGSNIDIYYIIIEYYA